LPKIVLYALVVATLLWRIAAVWYPHPGLSDPEIVSWCLAVMGLWFLLCTLWAYVHRPTRATALLLIYGVFSGLHWGGPISFGQESEQILTAFYLVVSSIGAQCVFLNLAVLGSTERRPGYVSGMLIYAPLVGGLVLMAIQLALPAQQQILSYILALVSVATVFGLIGAGLWVYGWARSARDSVIRFRRGVVAAALLGWIPPAFAMTEWVAWSGFEGLLNLTLSLEPAALAWFFTRDTDPIRPAS